MTVQHSVLIEIVYDEIYSLTSFCISPMVKG